MDDTSVVLCLLRLAIRLSDIQTRFRDRNRRLMADISPESGLKKVPAVVPRGAVYGAILLSARCHWMYQFASKVPQTGHHFFQKSQTETPTVLGFPA